MAGIKSICQKRLDVFNVDPLLIREEEGWNVRDDTQELRDHIRMLADSIKEIGVKQPLTVRMDGDVPILTDGHCRLMAVNLAISEGAEIKSVPVRVEDRYASDAEHVLSLLVRNSGKPLTPREQARPIKRLLDFGWTFSDISVKTGFSISKIHDLLALSAAPAAVNEMIDKGEISQTTAARAIRKHGVKGGEQKLTEAVEKAKDEGKTKASISDVIPSDQPSPVSIYNDGFQAGMIHALAILVDNTGNTKMIKEYRELLFGKDKIKLALAPASDRVILEGAFGDLS